MRTRFSRSAQIRHAESTAASDAAVLHVRRRTVLAGAANPNLSLAAITVASCTVVASGGVVGGRILPRWSAIASVDADGIIRAIPSKCFSRPCTYNTSAEQKQE